MATASPCNGTGKQTGNLPGAVVHQTALYDFVSSILLLTFLLWLRRRRQRYDGFLIFVFAVWYGAMRIIEDFLREDTRHFGLTGSQWSSIVVVAVCLGALLLLRRTPRFGRWNDDQPGEAPGWSKPEMSAPEAHSDVAAKPPGSVAPIPHQEE